jgi:hypothetical protein
MQLAQKQLKEVVNYNPDTGKFTWIKPPPHIKVGSEAGSLDLGHGYIRIRIARIIYYAHRLAWLYVYGNYPKGQIDHVNRRGWDNRISNLREADNNLQQRNRGRRSDNSSGYKGVYLDKRRGTWTAMLTVNTKKVYVGCFHTKEEAAEAIYKYQINHPDLNYPVKAVPQAAP